MKGPLRIFHGTSDKLIPVSEARSLAFASGDPSRLTEITDGEHNDIPMHLLRKAAAPNSRFSERDDEGREVVLMRISEAPSTLHPFILATIVHFESR